MEELKSLLSELTVSYEKLKVLTDNPKYKFRLDAQKSAKSLLETIVSLERLINKIKN